MLTDRNIMVDSSFDNVSEPDRDDPIPRLEDDEVPRRTFDHESMNLYDPMSTSTWNTPRKKRRTTIVSRYSATAARITGCLQIMWSVGIIVLSSFMLVAHGAIQVFCLNMLIGIFVFLSGTVGILSFEKKRRSIILYMMVSLASFWTMTYTITVGVIWALREEQSDPCKGLVYIHQDCDASMTDQRERVIIGISISLVGSFEVLTSYVAFIYCCVAVCRCSCHRGRDSTGSLATYADSFMENNL